MSSEYRVLKFHQSGPRVDRVRVMWVVSNDIDVCYCIEDSGDTVIIRREGPLSDNVPVATLCYSPQLSVAFGNEKAILPHFLLRTQSRSLKTLYNGNGQYQWLMVNDGKRCSYEVVNPRTPQTPFACLRVVGDESSTVILSLELSVDIWLHSSMCDGLVAAVVLMLKTHDAWLDLSGGSLVVRDEGGKSSTIGTSTVK